MYQYQIGTTLQSLTAQPSSASRIITLLTSQEVEQAPALPGLEDLLPHTPLARSARLCKAESHTRYLCGTMVTPRHTREQRPIAFGFLLTKDQLVLCDDSGAAHTMVQKLLREKTPMDNSLGSFLYAFWELLISKDMHHIQELEDQLEQMEDQAPEGDLERFNNRMTDLRKEISGWIRYYTQLSDLVCEFEENEGGYFSDRELHSFHLVEKRVDRLQAEAQTLREYGLQIRELFQAEIDIRQNRIMKILTVVTTIFLPLSLVAGWYGMNFVNMPELHWAYGYPAAIGLSVVIVLLSLWIMKKKKFW